MNDLLFKKYDEILSEVKEEEKNMSKDDIQAIRSHLDHVVGLMGVIGGLVIGQSPSGTREAINALKMTKEDETDLIAMLELVRAYSPICIIEDAGMLMMHNNNYTGYKALEFFIKYMGLLYSLRLENTNTLGSLLKQMIPCDV